MKKSENQIMLSPDVELNKQVDFKKVGVKICLYLPLVIWTVVTIYPFWYMMVLATRSLSEIFAFPPTDVVWARFSGELPDFTGTASFLA